MDAFKALTVGAKFKSSQSDPAMRLFRMDRKCKAVDGAGAIVGDTAEGEASSNIPLPQASPVLDIFGEQNKHAESHESGHHRAETVATEHKPLKDMTFKKKKNIWHRNDLQVVGVDLPAPIEHFSDLVRPPLSVPCTVVNNLFQRAHRLPTPIQMEAIPSLLHHRDILACSPTGSGKTIAFLVPLFGLLKAPDPEVGVRALIVTPTVELAQQIEREAFFLMKGQRWRFVQHGQTTKNKDIFIATPGRVVSLVEQKLLDLSNVQYLVFDEGDRLWDPKTDFITVIDKILTACCRKDKIVSLFTATLSERIENAARSVMGSDPIRIIVRGRQSANSRVAQRLVYCSNELGKVLAIRNLIREGIRPPVLIFVQSIERTKELYDEIRTGGLHIALMNAKMSVEEREETILQFRLGKIWFLVTTELLSRGIDFKNVGTVVNFDIPLTAESYIHRVGRTGRAGKSGEAITFFTEDDRERLPMIAKIIKDSGSPMEDWMLDIKVTRSERRRLQHTTPHRMIVSTRKRMLVAQERVKNQYRRLEQEEEAKSTARKKQRKGQKKESDEDAGNGA